MQVVLFLFLHNSNIRRLFPCFLSVFSRSENSQRQNKVNELTDWSSKYSQTQNKPFSVESGKTIQQNTCFCLFSFSASDNNSTCFRMHLLTNNVSFMFMFLVGSYFIFCSTALSRFKIITALYMWTELQRQTKLLCHNLALPDEVIYLFTHLVAQPTINVFTRCLLQQDTNTTLHEAFAYTKLTAPTVLPSPMHCALCNTLFLIS